MKNLFPVQLIWFHTHFTFELNQLTQFVQEIRNRNTALTSVKIEAREIEDVYFDTPGDKPKLALKNMWLQNRNGEWRVKSGQRSTENGSLLLQKIDSNNSEDQVHEIAQTMFSELGICPSDIPKSIPDKIDLLIKKIRDDTLLERANIEMRRVSLTFPQGVSVIFDFARILPFRTRRFLIGHITSPIKDDGSKNVESESMRVTQTLKRLGCHFDNSRSCVIQYYYLLNRPLFDQLVKNNIIPNTSENPLNQVSESECGQFLDHLLKETEIVEEKYPNFGGWLKYLEFPGSDDD